MVWVWVLIPNLAVSVNRRSQQTRVTTLTVVQTRNSMSAFGVGMSPAHSTNGSSKPALLTQGFIPVLCGTPWWLHSSASLFFSISVHVSFMQQACPCKFSKKSTLSLLL